MLYCSAWAATYDFALCLKYAVSISLTFPYSNVCPVQAKQPLNSSSSEHSPSTTGEQPGVVPDAAQPAQVPIGTAPPSNSTASQEASASLKQLSGMAQEPVQHNAAPQLPAAEDAIPILRRRAMLQQADPQTTTNSACQV